jgi:hypothetical protein
MREANQPSRVEGYNLPFCVPHKEQGGQTRQVGKVAHEHDGFPPLLDHPLGHLGIVHWGQALHLLDPLGRFEVLSEDLRSLLGPELAGVPDGSGRRF